MYRVLWAALLTVIVSFFFLPDANARASIEKSEFHTVGLSATGEKHHFLRYYEEKVWYVEEILQHRNLWLDSVSKKSFTTESEARNAQAQLQKKFGSPVAEVTAAVTEGPLPQLPSEVPGEVVWPTTQNWNWEWEQKYGEWLKENMNIDFYMKNNVATDCADVAYSARWIFARIHGLPAGNRLGSDVLFTNSSLRKEWSSLPTDKEWSKDRRFLAALNYVLNFTYTHTLMRDSYPVAINPTNFLPGIHVLNLGSASGHTQLVHRTNSEDPQAVPFMIIQSTIPRGVRVLSEDIYWGSEVPKKDKGGFLRIRWPLVSGGVYSLAPAAAMPGYSLEQYDPEFIREKGRGMNLEVMLRLNPTVNFLKIFEGGLKSLKDALEARVQIVEEGYKNCSAGQCPAGSEGHENWSTPSRDKKIGEIFDQLAAVARIQDGNNLSTRYFEALEKPLLTINDEVFTMKALRFVWSQKVYSSEPDVEPGLRWAAAPASYAKALQSMMAPLLEERTKKISADQDLILKNLIERARYYCPVFTVEQCQRYQTELQRPVTWIGKTRSFQEWMNAISWFNSDPRQTPEMQWGGLASKVPIQNLTYGDSLILSQSGFSAYIPREGKIRVGPMKIGGVENTPLPEGFEWRAYNKASSTGYAFAPGRLFIQDFVAGTRVEAAVPLQDAAQAKVEVLSQKRLLVVSKETVSVLQLKKDGKVDVRWQQTLDEAPNQIKGKLVVAKVAGAWHYMDFSTATPTVSISKWPEVGGFLGQNQKYLLVARGDGVHKIDRVTGEDARLSVVITPLLVTKDFRKALTIEFAGDQQKAFLSTLDEDLNVISKQELGLLKLSYYKAVVVTNGKEQKIYNFDAGNEGEYPMLPDEERITQFFGSWIATGLRNNKVRIRSLDGKKFLYEGDPAYFLEGPAGAAPRYLAMKPFHAEGHVVPFSALDAPAAMTGYFWNFGSFYGGNAVIDIDRGVIVAGSTGTWWVDL